MHDLIKFPLVLLIVCIASAVSLAGLYKATLPQKMAIEKQIQDEARKVVMPKAFSFKEISKDEGSYFVALDEKGNEVGFVVEGSATGYSSEIKVMVGVDKNFVVNGIKVLSQKETPGLGDKIEEIKSADTWVKKIKGESKSEEGLRPWFQVQFEGKKSPFKVKKDGGNIEAVTGATVSSRAVCDAVNKALEGLKSYL